MRFGLRGRAFAVDPLTAAYAAGSTAPGDGNAGSLGGCRCGEVRYVLAFDRLPRTYTCHCLDCQTWNGSAFSQQTFAPESALTVTGPLVIYQFIAPSGNVSTQRM